MVMSLCVYATFTICTWVLPKNSTFFYGDIMGTKGPSTDTVRGRHGTDRSFHIIYHQSVAVFNGGDGGDRSPLGFFFYIQYVRIKIII